MTLNRVVYLAIGEYYVSQAVLSLFSLVNVYRHSKPSFRVVILTDNGGPFEWLKEHLDLEVRSVDLGWIEETRRPNNFALRTKLVSIREMLYDDMVNVLFVDTDTIHLRKIDVLFNKLEQGFCYLHMKEWPLKKGRLKQPELCPHDLKFELSSGSRIEINGETEMWNSGVVGIAAKNRHLIIDALDLNDQFYEMHPSWHVEQFSLSIMLQQTGRLLGCRQKIFHYWHNKPFFDQSTIQFFSLIDAGHFDQALEAAKRLIPSLVFKINLSFFYSQVRNFIRDFPGIYLTYKKLIKPFL